MAHAKGSLDLEANGETYRLFIGMSVFADLQAKHGQDVLSKLDPPEGAGESWLPDMGIMSDLFMGALARYHGDLSSDETRWLADDLLSENSAALGDLMEAAFPPVPKAGEVTGKPKRAKKAASTSATS